MTDIQKRLQNLWLRGYREAVSGAGSGGNGSTSDRGWSAYNQGYRVGSLDLEAATTAAQVHALNATAEETSA